MNKDVMFSSASDLWETPQEFFDKLNDEFCFDLDVCALPENAKCKAYYTPEMDGLSQPWEGVCWCNPPYGRSVGEWVRRAWFASEAGTTVVMLLPARTDTRCFHEYIYKKENVEIRFVAGRLKFGGQKNSAPFPSMVCIFRPEKGKEPLLLHGTPVWYVDFENSTIEQGTIDTAGYEDGFLSSLSVFFEDDYDIFDGEGLGEYFFLSESEAVAALKKGEHEVTQ